MKSFRIRYILGLAITAIFLSSCEKEISLDLKSSTPRLVIEGIVQDGEYAKLKISKTKDYNDTNDYPFIPDATVTLRNDKAETETLVFDSEDGLYKSKTMRGEQGVTYYLTVDVENNTYTSESKLPYIVNIDSIYIYKMMKDVFYPMAVYKDSPNEENYYKFIVNHNDVKMPTILLDKDEDRDGRRIERILFFNLEDDEYIDIYEGDRFVIDIQCISKPVFDFYDAWDRIVVDQANPPCNITGGCLGYFNTYSTSSKEYIVKKEDLQ